MPLSCALASARCKWRLSKACPVTPSTLPGAGVPGCSALQQCFPATTVSAPASVWQPLWKSLIFYLNCSPLKLHRKKWLWQVSCWRQFLKTLTPIPCFKHWKNIWFICGFVCRPNSVVVGKFSMLNFTLISLIVIYSGLEFMIIDNWLYFSNKMRICFCRLFRAVFWAVSSAAISWPLGCSGRALTKSLQQGNGAWRGLVIERISACCEALPKSLPCNESTRAAAHVARTKICRLQAGRRLRAPPGHPHLLGPLLRNPGQEPPKSVNPSTQE